MVQNGFDVNKIRALSAQNPVAKAIFDTLKDRKRNTKELDLRRLYRMLKENSAALSREELYDVFRHLQTMGVGEISFGRRKKPNRFRWTGVKLLDLVDALNEEITQVEEKHKAEQTAHESVAKNGFSIATPDTGVPTESILIRKGSIQFEVSSNASNKTFIKLAKLIRRIEK